MQQSPEALLPELIGCLCEVLTLDNRPLFVGRLFSYHAFQRELQINLYRGDTTPGGVIYHTPVKLLLHSSFEGIIPILYATVLRCAPAFWRLELDHVELRINQRRSFRQQISVSGSVRPTGRAAYPCRLQDISVHGVRLLCPQLFKVGEQLSLEIPYLYPEGDPYDLSCIVRRVQEPTEAQQAFSYGCEFTALSWREEERMFHDLFRLQRASKGSPRTNSK